MKKMGFAFFLATLSLYAFADSKKTILDCPLSDGTKASLLSTSSEDGQQLFVKIDNQTETAFTDMPDSDFVGEVALAKCAGASLIYAMNYGSPYLKGALIRKSPASGMVERIDFAEKSLPTLLYVSGKKIRLVIPNEGYEVPEKFLVYDYPPLKDQTNEPKGMNTLPDRKGFDVFNVQ